MSDRQNWSGLGEQFKGALADALQSGDFTQLNDLVTGTVVNTLNEVGISFTQGADPPPEGREYSGASSKEAAGGAFPPFEKEKLRQQKLQHDWQRHMQRRQEEQLRRRQEQMRRQEEQLRRGKAQMQRQKEALMRGQSQLKDKLGNLSLIKFKKVGNVSNVLYQVFGGIGLGITSFITLIRIGAVFLGNTLLSPAGWIVNLIFLAIFGGMVRLGTSQGKRLRRARRYMQLCGDKMYGEIEHLAASIGKSTRYVTRDIQKMLSLGMFPEGHLDTKKTCFMLNDNVYRQYLETQKAGSGKPRCRQRGIFRPGRAGTECQSPANGGGIPHAGRFFECRRSDIRIKRHGQRGHGMYPQAAGIKRQDSRRSDFRQAVPS